MEPDNLEQQSPQSVSDQQQNKETLSKRQIRKVQKTKKWQVIKKQKRLQKRAKQKQKKKLLKALKKQQEQNQGDHQVKEEQEYIIIPKRKDQYKEKMEKGLSVVIDLQFYDFMTEKEKHSLIIQLSYCHSVNRKLQKSFKYIITSANEQRRKQLNTRYNSDNWGIIITQSSILQQFPKQSLVYLTGDAQQQVTQLSQKDIYIIGGIVDHNRLTKITYNFAKDNGIRCARLPMDGVQLKASCHLAVNHIWQWILKVYNGENWGTALKSIIPSRKIKQT